MRKSIRPLIALTAALALTVTAGMSALAQADNNEKHFSVIEAASNEDSLTIPEIAKKCGTSVVAIETETKVVYNTYDNDYYNPFGGMFGYGFGYGYGNRGGRGGTQEYTQKAAGSGVIISEDGYVLTNNHVISGADKITVYVNPGDGSEEKTYEATLIGSSESNDIAVLKIDATGLNAAAFGDSDQLEVGELAVAIGNQHGVYTSEPQLNFEVVERVRAAVSVPLVLHGASGIGDADIHTAISLGIAKINIHTELCQAAMAAIRDRVDQPFLAVERAVRDAVKQRALEKIVLFGTDGKADLT